PPPRARRTSPPGEEPDRGRDHHGRAQRVRDAAVEGVRIADRQAGEEGGGAARPHRARSQTAAAPTTAAPSVCVTPRWKASGSPTARPGRKSRSGALAKSTAPASNQGRCGPAGRNASYGRYP